MRTKEQVWIDLTENALFVNRQCDGKVYIAEDAVQQMYVVLYREPVSTLIRIFWDDDNDMHMTFIEAPLKLGYEYLCINDIPVLRILKRGDD